MILQEPLVRILHVLREIAVKSECWSLRLYLSHVFDSHHFPLVHRRGLILHDRQQKVIQLTRGNLALAVFENLHRHLKRFKDALLGEVGGENNGEL